MKTPAMQFEADLILFGESAGWTVFEVPGSAEVSGTGKLLGKDAGDRVAVRIEAAS